MRKEITMKKKSSRLARLSDHKDSSPVGGPQSSLIKIPAESYFSDLDNFKVKTQEKVQAKKGVTSYI